MSKNTISINKNLIPYNFDIELAGEIFTFHINYNYTGEFFTVGLSKAGKLICSGEPIVYGTPLFKNIYISGLFPAVDIVPLSPSNEYNAVTFDNLSESVLLIIDDGSISVLEGEKHE